MFIPRWENITLMKRRVKTFNSVSTSLLSKYVNYRRKSIGINFSRIIQDENAYCFLTVFQTQILLTNITKKKKNVTA